MTYAILLSCGLVGMVIGFLIGLACNGDVKKLNETINEQSLDIGELCQWLKIEISDNIQRQDEIDRLSDLVATLQAKVPARNARGKFVAR